MRLRNSVEKSADKVASLRSKMDSLKNTKIPTQEYKEISDQIAKANSRFDKLLEKQMQMQAQGKNSGAAWDKLDAEMEEVGNEIRYAKGELQDLIDTGKAFTIDTAGIEKTGQQLKYAESELELGKKKLDEYNSKQEKISSGYKKVGLTAKKALKAVSNALKSASATLSTFGKKLKEISTKFFAMFKKQADSSGKSVSKFGSRLKSLLAGIFIFNMISAAFRKMFQGITEGFRNLFEYNSDFKSSLNELKASLDQLKNSFAAAFAPVIQIAIPYIEKLISYLNTAVSSIAQFIAALFGKSTYTTAVKNISSGIEDVKESAEDAEKSLKGMLSPLDKLNVISTNKESKKGATGNTGNVLYEEVPVDSYFKNIADRLKEIGEQFFNPLKKAWNNVGEFVMDSWQLALEKVWELVKSIGSDFLEVWNQDATVNIFEDILRIIGNIGLSIGYLAQNFREVWESGETGKKIFEAIRDIIGVVVDNILHASEVTSEWAKNIDFEALLTSFQEFLEAMVPVADALSGILTDFYEKVLLPLGKWSIEKGLPLLLDTLKGLAQKVDWNKLRSRFNELWKSLEPFMERVGEGLILFIEDVGTAIADFINSEEFGNFLDSIADWMDSVDAQDVADGLMALVNALIALKVASVGFSALSSLTTALMSLVGVISFFGSDKFALAMTKLSTIGSTIAGWLPHVAVGIAIAEVIERIKSAVMEKRDTSGWNLFDWITETFHLAVEGWKSELKNLSISLELWWQDTWLSNAIWNFSQWYEQKVKPFFESGKWTFLLDVIKTAFTIKFTEIKNNVISIISSIVTFIVGKVNAIKTAITEALSLFNMFSIKSSVLSAGTGILGTLSYNLDTPDIPGYATGQVIPTTMQKHLAWLGDNKHETEVVSPLSTMKQAMLEALRESGISGGGSDSGDIVIEIDGNEVFRVVRKQNQEFRKQNGGKSAFA